MAKKQRRSTVRSRRNHRHGYARRREMRRRTDFYVELGKLAGLVGWVCIAILGQSELIGEPWRHYVTIVSIMSIGAGSVAVSARPIFPNTW